MLKATQIKNFRSVENATNLELAPITVIYGPTSAGKSTILYGLCALRNFILNPNQALDGFFNIGFQSLGGFDACVFNHDQTRTISLGASIEAGNGVLEYTVSLGKPSAKLKLKLSNVQLSEEIAHPINLSIEGSISIPYPVNQAFQQELEIKTDKYNINWNGVNTNVISAQPTADTQKIAQLLSVLMNSPTEALKKIDIVPHKRGFFKPSYSPVPISSIPTSEDEVATLIINDPDLPAKISIDTEEIFGRDFRTYVPPGTATVYFQTTDKRARTPVYLVNDGFGVNQVVYILAKIYRAGVETVLIEEPEVHLHPTVIRNLARRLAMIAIEEGKQLVFTTHSEQFLISLLTCVSEKLIQADSMKCYLANRDKRSTSFTEQTVSEKGQLTGGLASFVEAEVADLRKYMSIEQ